MPAAKARYKWTSLCRAWVVEICVIYQGGSSRCFGSQGAISSIRGTGDTLDQMEGLDPPFDTERQARMAVQHSLRLRRSGTSINDDVARCNSDTGSQAGPAAGMLASGVSFYSAGAIQGSQFWLWGETFSLSLAYQSICIPFPWLCGAKGGS